MNTKENNSPSLEELLGKNPINIPLNPFVDTGIRFGRDELSAMVLNTLSTAASAYILSTFFPAVNPILINSIVGPVVEKIGLVGWYFKDIFKKEERKNFFSNLKNGFKDSLPTLTEDILLHDPIYSSMLYLGQTQYNDTPVWILSLTVFVISVTFVACLEVFFEKFRYIHFKKICFRNGFKEEKYLESHFYIPSYVDPEKLILDVSKKFNLIPKEEIIYEDRYFSKKEKQFLRKNMYIRSRHRKRDGKDFNTFQFVFTEPQKMKAFCGNSSYNFFPSRKTKLYYVLNSELEDFHLLPENIQRCMKNFNDLEKPKYVRFKRSYAHDEELLITVDLCELEDSSFRLVEVKVYKDEKRLEEAMKYVLQNYPVEQTTYGKNSLI